MKGNLISYLIISLFILSGCKDNSPLGPEKPGVPSSDGLLPLKAGNEWTYRSYYLDGQTGEIKLEMPDSYQKLLIPEYIKGSFKGNLYEGFSWDNQFVGSEQDSIVKWVYINRPDGLYQVGGLAKTDTSINNILHYKYPVNKGESWLVPRLFFEPYSFLKFFIDDSVKYECTDTAAVFQTPIGDFKCYVYRHLVDLGDDIGSDEEYFEYFKPGFGMVGTIIKEYTASTGKSSYRYKIVLQSTNLPN